MDIQAVIDKYQHVRDQRLPVVEEFYRGERPFLAVGQSAYSFHGNCNTIEDCYQSNIRDFTKALDVPSDCLPYIEPWFGTGQYANAFGSEYVWREGQSPACHYACQSLQDIEGFLARDMNDGELFQIVLEAIEYFKDRTQGRLPICLTDTQSPHDTATLIVDAVEIFTASYSEPDLLKRFLQKITDLIISFSQEQLELIGECAAMPGHMMNATFRGGRGISISDDNLAVASPTVNREFLLPYDDLIGQAFGGVAIHSCGNWAHTMPLLREFPSVFMIDCALQLDPAPCQPESVRDALKGSGMVLQVRVDSDFDAATGLIQRVHDSSTPLVVAYPHNEGAGNMHERVTSLLRHLYD